MKIIKYGYIVIIAIIFTSCTNDAAKKSAIHTATLQNVEKSTLESFETQQLKCMDIRLQNADIIFSSWAKKEVRIEIETHITGDSNKDKLEKSITEFKPKISFADDMLTIYESTAVKSKKANTSNKIMISAPCEIRNVLLSVNKGSFNSFGDIITTATIKLTKGDINFTRFQGTLDANVTYGNIVISSGRLSGASKLFSQSGNVNVKTEILTNESYKFEVGTGNVDLRLPAKTYGDFTWQGNLVTNEFRSSSVGPKILVSSKEGAIYLKKY